MVMTAGDSDARRLAFPGLGQSHIRGRDWSAEATFNWSPDGPLHAVGGFSATHLALHQFINLSRLNGIGRFNDAQASAGIFGEASVTVFPGATLTAGLRYQQDRQKRSGALGTPLNKIPLDYDRTFHAWLPKVSLAYDISPAVRLGMFAERAYNPGGTTLRFDTGQRDNFGAEKLWDYEGFVRAKLGHGLSASGNLFYYDMRNAQRAKDINIIAPGGFGVGFADLFNVPRARSYGAEAELDWRPSTRLSGRFALGMLRTRIIRSAAGYAEFEGKEFARSPHLTAAAAVDWQANRRLRLSAQVRHHGRYFSDESNDPLLRIAGSTIADARAAYELGRASLFVQVRNVFDKLALVDLGDPDFGEAEDPRRFMIGIETRF